jgi:hypothetical protein
MNYYQEEIDKIKSHFKKIDNLCDYDTLSIIIYTIIALFGYLFFINSKEQFQNFKYYILAIAVISTLAVIYFVFVLFMYLLIRLNFNKDINNDSFLVLNEELNFVDFIIKKDKNFKKYVVGLAYSDFSNYYEIVIEPLALENISNIKKEFKKLELKNAIYGEKSKIILNMDSIVENIINDKND